MSRHDFSEPDKTLLAQRVGYHCSNPACGVATIGPSDVPTDKEYVGVAAHIYSASIDNGPRANPNLAEEERRSPANGIHLCNKCSTLIDKNKGAGYPAKILFDWKRCSEAAAKERIFKNTPYNIYTGVDFSNLEDKYSTALTCTGLSEKNVLSCPTNQEIVLEVVKKLNLANKCILSGSSGSGKSLLTYQIAYQFYLEGWLVFKVNKDSINNGTVLAAPTKKSLIIVDDAQIIEIGHLENLLGSAYRDCVVLANLNASADAGDNLTKRFPSEEIIPSSQIEMLKQFCLKNKKQIADTLRRLGLKVRSNDYFDCIENRIERASKEDTPWLFNYNLTEGWNSAKRDIALLRDDEDQHLVLVTVAAFQYATLDFGVVEEVIIEALKRYRNETYWLDKAKRTIRSKCFTNEGKVRNKHYEYSRKILAIFVTQKDIRNAHSYLLELLKVILESDQYKRGHSNILEFIMFDFRWGKYQLNNSGFIQKQAEDLINCDRELTPAMVNKINSLIRVNSDVVSLLKSQHNLIEDWILSCSKDTAYPLGNLLNTLINEKFGHLNSGTLLFDHLLSMIMTADVKDWSRSSHLINRMCFLLNEEDLQYAFAKLDQSGFSVNVSGDVTNIASYHFSSVVNDFHIVNQDWSEQQVANNIDGIVSLFNNDFSNALDYFKELIDKYFGIIGAILGIYNPTPTVKKHGREIAHRLDETAIVRGFNSVNATGVQRYSDILIFLALYNESKLKSISDQFNYDRLESLFCGLAKIDHYHRALVSILRNTDSPNWKKHVSCLVNNVDYVEITFFEWDCDLALKRLRNGTKYKMKIHMCRDCEKELIILKGVYDEEGSELAERIVRENKDALIKTICTKSQNGDDHKSKFDLLIFLLSKCDFIYREIFSIEKNQEDVIEKLVRLLRGKKWEKKIAKLYVFLIKEYSTTISPELIAVERSFPSISTFNIKDHICEG